MNGGVRQDCPLSPLLFAVCVDILLRMIEHRIPSSTSRAFADDLGTIIENWYLDAPKLETIFPRIQCHLKLTFEHWQDGVHTALAERHRRGF